jgi:O-acetyl-ADP-ribose deacetylase (regulator of RNase III)
MITFKTGNILVEDAEAIVNTVNCVGVMGRGIALQFKNVFPKNFAAYARACKREEVTPGRMFIFETGELTNPKFIINFPTKRHWKEKSRIEDIDAGLSALAADIQQRQIQSIAVPPLGCGLGGLDWGLVRSRIEATLGQLTDVAVIVFEPDRSRTETRPNYSRTAPKMSPGKAALIVLMKRYLNGLMDPFITLLEVHKLMYFMQVAGQPLRLRYRKGPYGPFAENLGQVLNVIEGHLITGYADGGDAPDKQLELIPGAAEDAEKFLRNEAEALERFDRVCGLVEGFESSFGLELLATVHWVASQEGAATVEDVVAKTYAWNDRKKRFSARQIGIAWNSLRNGGWLSEVGTSCRK